MLPQQVCQALVVDVQGLQAVLIRQCRPSASPTAHRLDLLLPQELLAFVLINSSCR